MMIMSYRRWQQDYWNLIMPEIHLKVEPPCPFYGSGGSSSIITLIKLIEDILFLQ